MNLLGKFFKNEDGSLAIQFGIIILPLLAVVGVGIDYSRVAQVETSLQATLDNNIHSLPASAFKSRAAFEKYIIALAGVNLDSETIKANLSIKKDKLHIQLSDNVKTPMMSLYGQPEKQVVASVAVSLRDVSTSSTANSKKQKANKQKAKTGKNNYQVDRSRINQKKRSLRKRIARIKAYKYVSSKRKKELLKSVRQQLAALKKL